MDKTFNIPTSDIGINAANNIEGRTEDVASMMLERMATYTTRQEEAAKTITEYVSVLVDILVNDDGSMKDIAGVNELKSCNARYKADLRETEQRLSYLVKSIPSGIECTIAKDDRSILEKNFQSWKDVFRLHIPIRLILAFTAALCIIGGMWMMKTGIDMKRQYQNQIERIDNP